MILAVILLIIAIGYAYKQREEPLAMTFAGGVLLVVGAFALIIFILLAANLLPINESWEDPLALATMGNALFLIPTGLILIITGFVLNRKK